MSTPYAVAAVTAVLRDRLRSRLVAAGVGAVVGTVEVSALPPDRIDDDDPETTRLNIFLHNVTLNQGWRNEGQPVRDAQGSRRSAPPLALDLHYLATAYGADTYHAEILLALASQELHESPILSPEQIRSSLTAPASGIPAPVVASELAEQVERLRIVPVSVPSDEMSRLWTALQAQYRPTVAFQVSVVLIDSPATPGSGLPALRQGSALLLMRRPTIRVIENATDPGAPVLSTSTIAVRGEQLQAPVVRLRLGAVEATPDTTADNLLTLDLTTLPASPRAGLVTVQVLHEAELGDPPFPHDAVGSEPAPLLLRPTASFVRSVAATTSIDGVDYHEGTITVTLAPPVGRDQRMSVLLNERDAPSTRAARSYAFPAPAGNGIAPGGADSPGVAIAYRGVASGTYVARATVDGVASPVGVGADGRFETPQLVFP